MNNFYYFNIDWDKHIKNSVLLYEYTQHNWTIYLKIIRIVKKIIWCYVRVWLSWVSCIFLWTKSFWDLSSLTRGWTQTMTVKAPNPNNQTTGEPPGNSKVRRRTSFLIPPPLEARVVNVVQKILWGSAIQLLRSAVPDGGWGMDSLGGRMGLQMQSCTASWESTDSGKGPMGMLQSNPRCHGPTVAAL